MTIFRTREAVGLWIVELVRKWVIPSGTTYKFALKRKTLDSAYLLSLNHLI